MPPEFNVTVIDAPLWIVSLTVAVMFTVCPAAYEPSAVLELNAEIVGRVVSIVTLIVAEVDVVEDDSSCVVDTAEMVCEPAPSVPVVQVQVPEVSPVTHALPVVDAPSYN